MPLAHSLCAGTAAFLLIGTAQAQQPGVSIPSRLETIDVTSTRGDESVQESPDSITVVSGEELRARGATDLRSALALVGGVSVYPGGDLGPSGASPSVLGRSESADFLLLVDGIPQGGAFIPAFATLDLHDVERIEVLRASAPVIYGTTAFAGTIHVIHYAAGKADRAIHLSGGSYGSASGDFATALTQGAIAQSLSADAERVRVTGNGVGSDRLHALYRLAADTSLGRAHVDADVTAQWQKPQSPVPVAANGLPTSALPPDFNQNPSDARLDSDVARLIAGLDWSAGGARWGSVLSLTRTWTHTIEGFFENFPADDGVGFRQGRQVNELFADVHATGALAQGLDATFGVNELAGRAQQDSTSFDYSIPLQGGAAPAGASLPGIEATTMLAHRSLFGLYLQTRWKPATQLSVLAGLRYNLAREQLKGSDRTASMDQSGRTDRPSGSFGASWELWDDPSGGGWDDVVLHAGYSNTFQASEIDFGPTAALAPLLKPETQHGFTAGIKAAGLGGRFDVDIAAFYADFGNLPLNGSVGGLPSLVAGGHTRYRGVEAESSYQLATAWHLEADASLDDAVFRNFNDAQEGPLAGKRVALTPRWRAALGLTYAPARGVQLAANVNGEGSRFLDETNRHRSGGYGILDALVGYRWDRCRIALKGANLTNRREPVLASELGDGQLYLLQPRHIDLLAAWSL